MSWASRSVLIGTCIGTISIVAYVHYKQEYDRMQLHLGVVRDIENQERRKAENIHILQQQQQLELQLRRDAQNSANTG